MKMYSYKPKPKYFQEYYSISNEECKKLAETHGPIVILPRNFTGIFVVPNNPRSGYDEIREEVKNNLTK